ncbi:MAG: tRNA adenosine(34) deaminase TadA [Cellvibrionaceae bacterium]|nr:tRNA adenosine(34) deaminase TadA [Cellvibrionaceae bacterium]
MSERDTYWMAQALLLARRAAADAEVPVGAVVVKDERIIGRGYNQVIGRCDPSAHAEVLALRDAARVLGNYRLAATTLYVTLEPCAMCAGAMVHSRVQRLVFAAREPKAGAVVSQQRFLEQAYLNHRIDVAEGVGAQASASLLRHFFAQRRAQKRLQKV